MSARSAGPRGRVASKASRVRARRPHARLADVVRQLGRRVVVAGGLARGARDRRCRAPSRRRQVGRRRRESAGDEGPPHAGFFCLKMVRYRTKAVRFWRRDERRGLFLGCAMLTSGTCAAVADAGSKSARAPGFCASKRVERTSSPRPIAVHDGIMQLSCLRSTARPRVPAERDAAAAAVEAAKATRHKFRTRLAAPSQDTR